MWTFLSKCGQALAIGLSGLILSWNGYVADAVQSPAAILAIRLLIGPVPAIVFALSVVVLSFYPITEKVYNEMMKKKNSTSEK